MYGVAAVPKSDGLLPLALQPYTPPFPQKRPGGTRDIDNNSWCAEEDSVRSLNVIL